MDVYGISQLEFLDWTKLPSRNDIGLELHVCVCVCVWPELSYNRFRQSLKTFLFGHWDLNAV